MHNKLRIRGLSVRDIRFPSAGSKHDQNDIKVSTYTSIYMSICELVEFDLYNVFVHLWIL